MVCLCGVLVAVTLAILPWEMAVAHREAIFCVSDLPRVKFPPGKFHGYVKKE